MFSVRITLIVSGSMFCHAVAQQTAAPGSVLEMKKAKISIVALGPKPTRKYSQTENGGVPAMLLAQPGETPPPRLYYKGKSVAGETPWVAYNVPFNNPPTMREITPGKELRLFKKSPDKDAYEHYVTLPAGEEGSRRVFFLLPATMGQKPWGQPPRVRMITLSAEKLQGKQFILKNMSRFTVLHAFDGSVVSVAPMKTISYRRAKTGQLYRLAARYGSEKKIIYNTAVRLNGDGHIQLYALYDANPKTNAGRSVGVFRMMVPARSP